MDKRYWKAIVGLAYTQHFGRVFLERFSWLLSDLRDYLAVMNFPTRRGRSLVRGLNCKSVQFENAAGTVSDEADAPGAQWREKRQ